MSVLKKNFGCRQDAIITDCFVVMPDGVTDANSNRRYCKIENAAWDTGATNTVITPEIVDALGLEPSEKHAVSTLNGIIEVNTYLIDLCFENGYRIANLRVLSGEDYSDFDYDVLIGMDVITQGDFVVSTLNSETSFSFRMPAQGITIE
jgi:predicted aspartyl protease